MWSETEKLIGRMLFVPITGIFTFLLFSNFGQSLNNVIYNLTENWHYHIFLKFDTREKVVFWASAILITAHFIFEVAAYFSKNFRFKRLLTNLRYAPIAILSFSLLIIPIYDAGMIAYSKRQIRSYVFSDSQTIEKPDFRLFNNYRHWCGNGAISWENYLYFDTAAEGINDKNPYVRSRSLLMSSEVNNFFNGGDERFDNFLANSCRDSDQIVRDVAESYLNGWDSTCKEFLLEK